MGRPGYTKPDRPPSRLMKIKIFEYEDLQAIKLG